MFYMGYDDRTDSIKDMNGLKCLYANTAPNIAVKGYASGIAALDSEAARCKVKTTNKPKRVMTSC